MIFSQNAPLNKIYEKKPPAFGAIFGNEWFFWITEISEKFQLSDCMYHLSIFS